MQVFYTNTHITYKYFFNNFYNRIYLMDKVRPIFAQLTQSVSTQKVIYLLLTQNQFDLFHWRNLRDSEKFEKENA